MTNTDLLAAFNFAYIMFALLGVALSVFYFVVKKS
jgi:hypothetical protein